MRFRHILSETWGGLRRNLSMNLAVIVTMWVSLSLFGGGLLASQQVDLVKGNWYDKIEISVFMCTPDTRGDNCDPDAAVTSDQRDSVKETLETNPEVASVYFETKEQAYTQFNDAFEGSPIQDSLTVEQMQESFRVKLKNPEEYQGVVSAVSGLSGVQAVQDMRQYLDPLIRILNLIRNAAWVTSALLLLAAGMQITNTIRMAAFARRREIGIMRLVGASNLYIMLPFLFEALIAGIVGGALACATLGSAVYFLIIGKAEVSIQALPWIGWSHTLWAMGGVAIVAVVLSIIPTLVATRRYLNV